MTVTPPPGPPPYETPPGGGGLFPPPSHRQAVTVGVLGVVGLISCPVVSPFAWVMGRRAVADIDASAGHLGGRQIANTGRILGIIGTVLLALEVLAGVAGGIYVLSGRAFGA